MQRQFSIRAGRSFITHTAGTYISRLLLLLFFLIGSLTELNAQFIVYDQEDIYKARELDCMDDYLNVFPSIRCAQDIEGAFNPLPVYMNSLYNTGYAKSMNDGPVMQGKGFNTTIGFGFSGKVGRLTYVVNPIVQYSQNQAFYTGGDLTSSAEYQYPYFQNRLDYVMRYGDDPYFKIFPGQSEISLDLSPVEIALSTQNMIWGPGIYMPIMMSTNAPGIPHFRIGTSEPVNTAIGRITGNMYWGVLEESDYFNSDPDDDWRYFTAINLGYRPGFWEEMTIGIHRTFYAQTRYLSGFLYDGFINFSGFFSKSKDRMVNGRLTNDYYDQNMSITFDWKDDNSDLNIYAEWTRGDFAGDFLSLLEQYERQSGYMYGFTNNFKVKDDIFLRMTFEHTSLATWSGDSFEGLSPPIYTHHINYQGYSNDGQVLGSFVGPGAQADMLVLRLNWGDNFYTLGYHRTRFNDDYFYTTFKDRNADTPQDIEHLIELSFESEYKNVTYNIGGHVAARDNYLFDPDDYIYNFQTRLTLRYAF